MGWASIARGKAWLRRDDGINAVKPRVTPTPWVLCVRAFVGLWDARGWRRHGVPATACERMNRKWQIRGLGGVPRAGLPVRQAAVLFVAVILVHKRSVIGQRFLVAHFREDILLNC